MKRIGTNQTSNNKNLYEEKEKVDKKLKRKEKDIQLKRKREGGEVVK